MDNLDWSVLDILFKELPQAPKQEKNFIEIAGYPSWENVNSNFFAFYFDDREKHPFKGLFLSALMEVFSKKSTLFFDKLKGEISVEATREYRTEENKRLDILLQLRSSESEGAVLIENKINHKLNNPLEEYWNSVKEITKIGIVLSRYRTSINEFTDAQGNHVTFINITHQELIDQIEPRITDHLQRNADSPKKKDRSQLLLQEFLDSMKSHYIMDENYFSEILINHFHNKGDHIKGLIRKDEELGKDIFDKISEVFTQKLDKRYIFSLPLKGDKLSTTICFNLEKKELNNSFDPFSIVVKSKDFRYKSVLECNFELTGDNSTNYGKKVTDKLNENPLSEPLIVDEFGNQFKVELGMGPEEDNGISYTHVYTLYLTIVNLNSKNLVDTLADLLNRHFINKQFIEKAYEAL